MKASGDGGSESIRNDLRLIRSLPGQSYGLIGVTFGQGNHGPKLVAFDARHGSPGVLRRHASVIEQRGQFWQNGFHCGQRFARRCSIAALGCSKSYSQRLVEPRNERSDRAHEPQADWAVPISRIDHVTRAHLDVLALQCPR